MNEEKLDEYVTAWAEAFVSVRGFVPLTIDDLKTFARDVLLLKERS